MTEDYGVCAVSSNGGQSGATGTFYTSITNICDSGSLSTTCTLSSSRSIGDTQSLSGTGNFVVANGGILKTVTPLASLSITISGDLTIQNGGKIAANISSANTANVYVNTGGSIDASGLGYVGGGVKGSVVSALKGTGGGVDGGYGGGGASHGGLGGGSGPAVYGSNINPVTFGSGGGGGGHSDGAPGGGVVKLTASSSIVVDGTVKVNGLDGSYGGVVGRPGGGGAGGSVWLISPAISGAGSVTAKGGDHYFSGSYNGEGGGGGRIALEYTTSGLATPTAIGGSGGNGATGGANGTVCLNGGGGSC